MKKKLLSLKNIGLIAFMAVAALFGAVSVAIDRQVDEDPVFEEASASTDSKTTETTRIIWKWDSFYDKANPSIQYSTDSGGSSGWSGFKDMHGDGNKSSGIAYYDIPANIYYVQFKMDCTDAYTGQTKYTNNLRLQEDESGLLNTFYWHGGWTGDGKMTCDQSYNPIAKETTRIIWEWSNTSIDITPHIQYLGDTTGTSGWSGLKAMSGTTNEKKGVAFYDIPAGAFRVVFSRDASWTNKTDDFYLTKNSAGLIKNTFTWNGTWSGSTMTGSWSYHSGTKETTRFIWNWDYTSLYIMPYLSYLDSTGWHHFNRMNGSNHTYGERKGVAYFDVPANSYAIIFVHSTNGSTRTNQTNNLLIENNSSNDEHINNAYTCNNGWTGEEPNRMMTGSWSYCPGTNMSTWITWRWTSNTWEIKPYLSYFDPDGWHHWNEMTKVDEWKTSGYASFKVPENVYAVIFVHSDTGSGIDFDGQTANLLLEDSDGYTKNLCYSTNITSSSFGASWDYTMVNEDTTLYWKWSGQWGITPIISYYVDGTWVEKDMTTTDSGAFSGLAWWTVPKGTTMVYFKHKNSSGSTTSPNLVSSGGRTKNFCISTTTSGSNDFTVSWEYHLSETKTRIVWKHTGNEVNPYIKFCANGNWTTPAEHNAMIIVNSTTAYYDIPAGTAIVILENYANSQVYQNTGNQYLVSDLDSGKIKNVCTSTVGNSSCTASWSSSMNSGDGIYVKPCPAWDVAKNPGDNDQVMRIAVKFFNDYNSDSAACTTWMTLVPGQTNIFEASIPGTNACYQSCLVFVKDGVKASDERVEDSQNLHRTVDISVTSGYCGNNLITLGDGLSGDWKRNSYTISGDYDDIDRALSWGKRFIDMNLVCDGEGSITTNKWSTAQTEYSHASLTAQGIIYTSYGNEDGNDVEKAVNRYDYVIRKYGTGTYNDFINRVGTNYFTSGAFNSFKPFMVLNDGESNVSIIIIIVASSVALLSITALSVLVVKKRKIKEE